MNDLYQYGTTTKVIAQIASSTKGIDIVGGLNWVLHALSVVNSWLALHVGVTLLNIAKAIANFFIWILQFMVETIKQGMALLK